MAFIIDSNKILVYKLLEESYNKNLRIAELYINQSKQQKERMKVLAEQILKEAGVI